MSKETITHENLRKVMAELQKDFRNAPEEAYRRLFEEFKYSNLICAGEMKDDEFKFFTCSFIPGMSLAAVFTDMNELRNLGDDLKGKLSDPYVILLLSDKDGKVSMMVAASDTAVKMGAHAGNLIKGIAKEVGGGGGGRPNMAQAGGKNPAGIDKAMALAKTVLEEQIKA